MLVPPAKLKTLVFLIAGLSGSAFAAPQFTGFYVGANAGVVQTDARLSMGNYLPFYANTGTETIANNIGNTNVYSYSGIGSIFLGYGEFYCNSRFYWGAEIFGNWARRQANLSESLYTDFTDSYYSNFDTSVTARLNRFEAGIDLRPGYLMDTNTLLYARLGLVFNTLNLGTTEYFQFTSLETPAFASVATYVTQLSQARHKSVTGVRLGFGLEHLVTDSLAVTFDYIYTFYGKTSTSTRGTVYSTAFLGGEFTSFLQATPDPVYTNSTGRIATQSASLGLKYYFYA